MAVRIHATENARLLEVEDTGPGMPQSQLAAFAISEWRQMPPLSGTELGLGLAVVREIATVLGVQMTIDGGAQSTGTIVRIKWLPA